MVVTECTYTALTEVGGGLALAAGGGWAAAGREGLVVLTGWRLCGWEEESGFGFWKQDPQHLLTECGRWGGCRGGSRVAPQPGAARWPRSPSLGDTEGGGVHSILDSLHLR